MTFFNSVPCNGCTACCVNDMIMLHPEMGDNPSNYLTTPAVNPITGTAGHMIAKKPNGHCVYLGDRGCEIHGRAPAICREFDCRKMLAKFSERAEQRRLLKTGMVSKAVFNAAKERLHTMESAA